MVKNKGNCTQGERTLQDSRPGTQAAKKVPVGVIKPSTSDVEKRSKTCTQKVEESGTSLHP